jgi:lysyl-tRNA synthetase, class II
MAEEDLIEVRRQKAAALRELGIHPFGTAKPVAHTIRDLLDAAPRIEDLPEEAEIPDGAPIYALAGRVLAIRRFGKGAFVRLRDRSLEETQLFLSKAALSDLDWQVQGLIDVGDHVRAEGPQFRTRRGDRAVRASAFTLLTKALRPLPEKWHGLTDKEVRYRQRYVDLIANEAVRRAFVIRTRAVAWIRRFLDERGFMEVETPMMHSLVSGATARPFTTHHNALDIDLNMRIAPELHLKRLVVGGFERVYEIGRNFRNEGLSQRHNPEFTMLEFYWAHATWNDLMDLTEEMIVGLVRDLGIGAEDDPLKVGYQGEVIDFTPPWPRLSMRQAIVEHMAGITEEVLADEARLREAALRIAGDDAAKKTEVGRLDPGGLVGFLFEEGVEHKLLHPTFITGFPVSVSPLARRNDETPDIADRFELIVARREIANAFNELGDPDDQRGRFEAQVAAKAAGALETMDYDEDFVRALEHGLPPTAGEGIGIDRLVMLLTDAASIRDVILFPLMRPE